MVSLPVASWRRLAQRDTSACLAPGASFSSLHEWLRKAVTCPIDAGTVRSWSVGPATGGAAVMLLARSAAYNRLAGRQRRSLAARSRAASGALPPTSAATAAASSASVPRPPRRPRQRRTRPLALGRVGGAVAQRAQHLPAEAPHRAFRDAARLGEPARVVRDAPRQLHHRAVGDDARGWHVQTPGLALAPAESASNL